MTRLELDVGTHGKTTAEIHHAADPSGSVLILAHGAGAPRTHPFMTDMAARIAARGIDVVTFNFLYAEVGRKMPDRVPLLEACWRAAIATVRARAGLRSTKLFIGGKSMGGRIATRIAAAKEGLELAGVVLIGYPLHPIGRPTTTRGEILGVDLPMLVVQGTRDELGTAKELRRFLAKRPAVRFHVVEGGDHSLALPRTRRPAIDDAQQNAALESAARSMAEFMRKKGAGR